MTAPGVPETPGRPESSESATTGDPESSSLSRSSTLFLSTSSHLSESPSRASTLLPSSLLLPLSKFPSFTLPPLSPLPRHEDAEASIEYPPTPWVVVIAASACLATFLVRLDGSIISPALGRITDDFGSVSDVGWYGSAFFLPGPAVIPLMGQLFALFPARYIFAAQLAVFELGSLVCALAPSSHALIAGRVVAGLGGTGLFSSCVIVFAALAPLRRRAVLFGVVGACVALGDVLGALLGGAFAQAGGRSWRWCFGINLPLGGLGLLVFWFASRNRLPDPDAPRREREFGRGLRSLPRRLRRLDLAGVLALTGAVVMLLLALEWGGTAFPWSSSRIIGLFCGSAAMWAVFAAVEWRMGDAALLPPRFLRYRDLVLVQAWMMVFTACMYSLSYYLSIYFEAIHNESPLSTGIRLLPLIVGTALTALSSGIVVSRLGRYSLFYLVGSAVQLSGAALLATSLGTDAAFAGRVFAGLALYGLGAGVVYPLPSTVSQKALAAEPHLIPRATAFVQFPCYLGGAVGLSACQAAFANGAVAYLRAAAPALPDPRRFVVGSIGDTDILATLAAAGEARYYDAVREAYMHGVRNAFRLFLAAIASTPVIIACLRWRGIGGRPAPPASGGKKDEQDSASSDVGAAHA